MRLFSAAQDSTRMVLAGRLPDSLVTAQRCITTTSTIFAISLPLVADATLSTLKITSLTRRVVTRPTGDQPSCSTVVATVLRQLWIRRPTVEKFLKWHPGLIRVLGFWLWLVLLDSPPQDHSR